MKIVEIVSDALIVLGAAVVAAGIWMACPVAGIVTAGIELVALGVLVGRAAGR